MKGEKNMKRFTQSVKDSLTGMELILSECSFNEACMFLQNEMKSDKYIGCEAFEETTKIMFKRRNFFYDEKRGYLLGE